MVAIGIGLATGLAWELAFVQPADSALFACTEAQGVTIITDSPTQLSQCHPLSTDLTPVTHDETSPHAASVPPPSSIPPAMPKPSVPSVSPLDDSPPRPSVVTIPLERLGSLFVIAVQLNQTRPARLILDTGASHTILSHAIARDLGLFSSHPSASVAMHTVGGTVQADMVRIDSLRLAEAEVHDSVAAIYDLPDAPPDIEGLLGLSVLRHFELTLDTARNQLHLGPPKP